MNHREICGHCGHVTTAYTLNLNEPLMQAFLMFAERRVRAGRPIKKGEIELAPAQYSNFQNLRHMGLIQQEAKGAAWEMTPLGWEFIRGQSPVLNPAGHMGGMTLPVNHPAWTTHEGDRNAVWIKDVLPSEWRDRMSFAQEKAGAA